MSIYTDSDDDFDIDEIKEEVDNMEDYIVQDHNLKRKRID